MASFRCYDNSDVIATLIMTNFHLFLIQLWWQFFQMFVYGDIVYAQTWQVLTLKNCIEALSRASTAYVVASYGLLFGLFCKNLGNLQEFFGQMVYRPPLAKNCPYAYAHYYSQFSLPLVLIFSLISSRLIWTLNWYKHFYKLARSRSIWNYNPWRCSKLFFYYVSPFWNLVPLQQITLIKTIKVIYPYCWFARDVRDFSSLAIFMWILWEKILLYRPPKMAALSRGCKPRIIQVN